MRNSKMFLDEVYFWTDAWSSAEFYTTAKDKFGFLSHILDRI